MNAQQFDHILNESAKAFWVLPDEVLSKSRNADVVDARWTAAWVMRGMGLSYPLIGRRLGCHHTTIMHAIKGVEDRWDLRIIADQIMLDLPRKRSAA